MPPRLRFLITRLSHIGDCVLTLPLAEQLKKYWPKCQIIWAMESPTDKLLGDHPHIDRIIKIPRGYLKRPSEIWRLRTRLREEKIDVALDPQSLSKSSLLAWLSGAKVRIGMGGKHAKELSPYFNNVRCTPPILATHLVDRTLNLLPAIVQHVAAAKECLFDPQNDFHQAYASLANFAQQEAVLPEMDVVTFADPPVKQAAPRLRVNPIQAEWAAEQCSALKLGTRWMLLNPGASWPSKRWENDRFARVASEIFQRHGLRTLVTWAGKEEKRWAEEICAASSGAVMAPDSTLPQFAALAQAATFFLGCDTGPMHIAAAVGTRCIVLLGPTRAQDSGPYGPRHLCLQAWHHSGGARERRGAGNDAMRDIAVETVVAGCESMLASSPDISQP